MSAPLPTPWIALYPNPPVMCQTPSAVASSTPTEHGIAVCRRTQFALQAGYAASPVAGFTCPVQDQVQYFCCGTDTHRYCCVPEHLALERKLDGGYRSVVVRRVICIRACSSERHPLGIGQSSPAGCTTIRRISKLLPACFSPFNNRALPPRHCHMVLAVQAQGVLFSRAGRPNRAANHPSPAVRPGGASLKSSLQLAQREEVARVVIRALSECNLTGTHSPVCSRPCYSVRPRARASLPR